MSSGGLFSSGILLPLSHGGFSGIRSCVKDLRDVGWWPVGKKREPGGCWSFGKTPSSHPGEGAFQVAAHGEGTFWDLKKINVIITNVLHWNDKRLENLCYSV